MTKKRGTTRISYRKSAGMKHGRIKWAEIVGLVDIIPSENLNVDRIKENISPPA